MNLHCKCGNPILDFDFNLDPSGTWCRECWSISQNIINIYEKEKEEKKNTHE